MNDNKEQLYQFGVNASGGARYIGSSVTYVHTLQLLMGRDDAIDLLIALANELKTSDDAVRIELSGKMLVAGLGE